MEYQFNKKAAKAFIKDIIKTHTVFVRTEQKHSKIFERAYTPSHKEYIAEKITFAEIQKIQSDLREIYKESMKPLGSDPARGLCDYCDLSHALTLTHILYNQIRHKRAHTKNDEIHIASKDYQNLVERFAKLFPILEDSPVAADTSCATE
jgi:hypothetical protein